MHLAQVFARLNHYRLILNKDKCAFCLPKIKCLGQEVSEGRIQLLDKKIEAIRDFPTPQNMNQLRWFLGMVIFYRCFKPNAAGILHPLQSMSSPYKTSGKTINWDYDINLAFGTIKEKLASITKLAFHLMRTQTQLPTDALGTVVALVLQQVINDEAKPITFFSKALNSAQKNYFAFDRKLLATYLLIRHFKYFLEGRSFSIFTDHKPLIYAFVSLMKMLLLDKCNN